MSFLRFSSFNIWLSFCLKEPQHLYNTGRGHCDDIGPNLFLIWPSGSGVDAVYFLNGSFGCYFVRLDEITI